MPIYEYQCADCGHHQEFLQKISDAPLANCPKCNKSAFNKIISKPGAFDLKGNGWYVTDFKNPPKTNGTGST